MPTTESTIFYTDPIIAWYQSATVLEGYLWVEQNGQVVGGTQDTPLVAIPPQTGDTRADIETWITDAITELQGGSVTPPDPLYTFGGILPVANSWGVAVGIVGSRPAVALGATYDFQFGDANVPVGSEESPRVWKFKIFGSGANTTLSPSRNAIQGYITAEGSNPILLTMELTPE